MSNGTPTPGGQAAPGGQQPTSAVSASDDALLQYVTAQAVLTIENRDFARRANRWAQIAVLITIVLALFSAIVALAGQSMIKLIGDYVGRTYYEERLKGQIETQVSGSLDNFKLRTERERQRALSGFEQRLTAMEGKVSSFQEDLSARNVVDEFLALVQRIDEGGGISPADAESALKLTKKLIEVAPATFEDRRFLEQAVRLVESFAATRRFDWVERLREIMGDVLKNHPSSVYIVLSSYSDELLGSSADPSDWSEESLRIIDEYADAARTLLYPEYAILVSSVIEFARNESKPNAQTDRLIAELNRVTSVEAGYVIFQLVNLSVPTAWSRQNTSEVERIAAAYGSLLQAYSEQLQTMVESQESILENLRTRMRDHFPAVPDAMKDIRKRACDNIKPLCGA